MEETSHSLDETSHIETWPPEKVALVELVEAVRACRIRALATHAPTIRTASLLYALVDPKRCNKPSAAQLREAARIARRMAGDVVGMARVAECAADHLERRTTPASVKVSSHQNARAI